MTGIKEAGLAARRRKILGVQQRGAIVHLEPLAGMSKRWLGGSAKRPAVLAVATSSLAFRSPTAMRHGPRRCVCGPLLLRMRLVRGPSDTECSRQQGGVLSVSPLPLHTAAPDESSMTWLAATPHGRCPGRRCSAAVPGVLRHAFLRKSPRPALLRRRARAGSEEAHPLALLSSILAKAAAAARTGSEEANPVHYFSCGLAGAAAAGSPGGGDGVGWSTASRRVASRRVASRRVASRRGDRGVASRRLEATEAWRAVALACCGELWHAVAWRRVEFNDSVGLFTGFAKRACHAMRGTCGMQREGMRAAAPKPNWRNSGIVSEA